MNRVQKLYELTEELRGLLSSEITDDNRAEIIEKTNELVEKREAYISALHPPYTEVEKALGEKLIPLNTEIQEKMQRLYDTLKLEIKNVKKRKKSNRSYINPYASTQNTDGMFMDSKK